VRRGEIEGRLDAIYYSGELFGFLKTTKYVIKKLNQVTTSLKSGFGAGKQDQDQAGQGIIQIRPTNLGNEGNLKFDRNVYLPLSLLETEQENLLQKGDVLFNNTNSQELVGKTVYFYEEGNFLFSNHITRIRVKQDELLPQFLALLLNAFHDRKVFYSICTNWNNQSGVGIELLGSLKIPIPPLETQAHIIAIFEVAYAKKRRKEAEAQALLDSIDGYLLSALGLTLPPPTERKRFFYVRAGQVSGGRFDPFYHSAFFQQAEKSIQSATYSFTKFKAVIKQLKTGTTPHQKLQPFDNEGIMFLRNSDLKPYELDLSEIKFVKDKYENLLIFSYKNEVIICIAGTVGTSAVNQFDELIAINQNITSIKLNENLINPHFLVAYLNSKLAIELTKRVCSVATIYYLNNENLNNLSIPLPPLAVQTDIANHIAALRAEAKQLFQQADAALAQAKQVVEGMILGET